MPPVGFEPTNLAGERLQTYAFKRRGHWDRHIYIYIYIYTPKISVTVGLDFALPFLTKQGHLSCKRTFKLLIP